jgi:DDE superfamily endonuclease
MYTLAERGTNNFPIRGAEVAPYLIFNGKDGDRGRVRREVLAPPAGYPVNCIYAVQSKVWMDKEKMLDWIRRVWRPHIKRQQPTGCSYLILDEYCTHLTNNVKKEFEKCKTEVNFIPGGYTSRCQMLHVGVNKPFKNHVTYKFNNWMVTTGQTKPQQPNVSHWIDTAWKQITEVNIARSWRKVGIQFDPGNANLQIDDTDSHGSDDYSLV